MKIRFFAPSLLALAVSAGALSSLRAADPAPAPEKKPTYEELQKMTPAERRAKIKELRANRTQSLTPEQKEARRKVVRERMEKRIAELQKKKAEGTLSEAEATRLELWQQRLKRLDAASQKTALTQPGDKPAEPR
jgi:hypothetical protein